MRGVHLLGKPHTIPHLSHSSVSLYAECPRKYYLSRIGGLDKSTWFVTLMGSVVHHITEQGDLRDAGLPFREGEDTPDAFDKLFDEQLSLQKQFETEVKASGRQQQTLSWAGGPNKKDADWCRKFGPLIVDRWFEWREDHALNLAVLPDGTIGNELTMQAPVGGVNFLGYVDRVFANSTGEVVVVDLKTGDVGRLTFDQVRLYALQLRRTYGVDVVAGGYWGRVAGTQPKNLVFDVKDWLEVPPDFDHVLDSQFRAVARGMEDGIFYGNTGSMFCRSCPVRDYCSTVDGEQAHMIPEPSYVRVRRPGETQFANKKVKVVVNG